MAKTFFFYDLETSGLNPREDRIMQFAGQRTDMDFNPVGDPVNIYIKLNDDTIPSPYALLVTGITPQKTVEEGFTEAEFARMAYEEYFTPDTIAVGFNNIRFDDEFMRAILWRNFYDPYEWTWKDGRSRWDLLDVVRLTRALRPEGIEWPFTPEGAPTNRLELLTKLNGIEHENAHDALADVDALIAVTRLIKTNQPKLYEYLLEMRDKKKVMSLINLDDKKPFVYSSGRYDNQFNKTTVAFPVTAGRNNNVVVYDLRYDPTGFLNMSVDELKKHLYPTKEMRAQDGFTKLPAKELQYNRAPAVAPLGVLEQSDAWQKIDLDFETIEANRKKLIEAPHFVENLRSLFETASDFPAQTDPEARLYDGFLNDRDRIRVEAVRNCTVDKLADFHPEFQDDRLDDLLLHYKARSFPSSLSKDEMTTWEEWRTKRLTVQMKSFVASLQKLSQSSDMTADKQFVLEELGLWAEGIMPTDDVSD
ncbi:MAG: exodeoxyribonuclease I [bacterium]|nr:exodeoxyribonuclease I [bacterium]MDN5835602.1 exodeoxyribonuclease I [bacterium]